MKWAFLSLLMVSTAFGDFPQMLCASKQDSKKVTVKSQIPAEEEPDIDLFRPNDQVLSTHLEFLYWKTLEGDLMYAQKMTQPAWAPDFTDNAVQGNYKNGTFNIDPGFRISQSFFRAARYWELWASYTRLTSRGENNVSAPNSTTEFLTSAWPLPLMGQLTNARSSLHLNYNVADFYADRYFNPNPHLRIRMIAGLTGAWFGQNWTLKYFDVSQQSTRIRNAWNYWGCGLRFGMHADWFWTNDVYLTVRGTLAGIVGPYHNRNLQTTDALAAGHNSTLPIRKASYRDTRASGNLQLLVGPSWQKNWTGVRTELFVGYELNVWSNLQEVYHSTLGSATGFKETWINSSLIALQGLTTRFTIDY